MGEQLLKLSGKVLEIQDMNLVTSKLFSVSTNPLLPDVLKASKAFLVCQSGVAPGFVHYLVLESKKSLISELPKNANYTLLPNDYDYLGDQDVIRLSKETGTVRVLYRNSSRNNSILVTEQCDHYCLMCSQPPKKEDDSWLLDEIKSLIPLIPRTAGEICFSGGEPTLYGERFLEILKMTKSYLPNTSVHILSNGRVFKDAAFTLAYADIKHPDMMVGIPIYSDDPTFHDYIVQAKGAFDETILGVLNLKRLKQKVEIRVVIHQQSIKRLKSLCEFLVRNLLFVDHVALMGLEITGFTRANLNILWIDPFDYRDLLSEAVWILVNNGINVSVYNHQLCLVNSDIWPYCRKSISDWKNEYLSECSRCAKRNECGGFFTSGIQSRYSDHIFPL